jgi:hypothetical protein
MHRAVLGLSAGDRTRVDHKDHDTLDNRRSNLRVSTRSQNSANQLKTRGTSKYKGVHKLKDRWKAQIEVDGKKRYLGSFVREEEAARAYDAAAVEAFGEFALINFPRCQ